MRVPKETAATTVRMSVVLNSSGRVGGAFKPTQYRPAKESDDQVVTVSLEAGPGQSIVEVEVPAEMADLEADELISRLAEHSSIRAAIANTPTASQANWVSSPGAVTALPFGVSEQERAGISAGQGPSPFAQSFGSVGIGRAGTVTASQG
jgi:hypothetical protein